MRRRKKRAHSSTFDNTLLWELGYILNKRWRMNGTENMPAWQRAIDNSGGRDAKRLVIRVIKGIYR